MASVFFFAFFLALGGGRIWINNLGADMIDSYNKLTIIVVHTSVIIRITFKVFKGNLI